MKLIRKVYSFFYKKFAPVAYARSIGVSVGQRCRLINVDFGSEPYLIKLGNHVSATQTSFVTHDGGVWVFRDEIPGIDVIAPITVGDNVFFGLGAIVLPGVTIGDNVVIAAGAVVSKDISSGVVAAGVPAKEISNLTQYKLKLLERSVGTKGLDPTKKREKLEKLFFTN